jgi:hypothetical protein
MQVVRKKYCSTTKKLKVLTPYEYLGKTRGVLSHTMALPFTLKKNLKGKRRNYGNSNIISPSKKKKIFKKKIPLKETKILQNIRNSIINYLKFQHKPKYHLSKILI